MKVVTLLSHFCSLYGKNVITSQNVEVADAYGTLPCISQNLLTERLPLSKGILSWTQVNFAWPDVLATQTSIEMHIFVLKINSH